MTLWLPVMKKAIFETRRFLRVKPKVDFLITISFIVCFIVLILNAEFVAQGENDYFRAQSGYVVASLILLIYRLSTSYDWVEHYKETINWFVGATRIDGYVAVSLLNVLLDMFVLSCLFFWVDAEHVSFLRVSVVGVVYVLLFAFSALKRFISAKLEERKKKNS